MPDKNWQFELEYKTGQNFIYGYFVLYNAEDDKI
mgnify:CR=1 FL=1